MIDLDALDLLVGEDGDGLPRHGEQLPWTAVGLHVRDQADTFVAAFCDGSALSYAVLSANVAPGLIAELRAAREVLREVEWCATDHGLGAYCPCCDAAQDFRGHESDCRLARVLR